jgi:uncharacterized membrane protein
MEDRKAEGPAPGEEPGDGDRTIEDNLRAVAQIEQEALRARSIGERIGDGAARIIGSMPFVVFHFVWFALWIGLNLDLVPGVRAFDPFPFGLLTLVVSLEAIFLSLFLLISQNRMTRQAEKRSHLDLQINLLAEEETTKILRILEKIAERVGVPPEERPDTDLDSQTDILKLASRVDEKMPDS